MPWALAFTGCGSNPDLTWTMGGNAASAILAGGLGAGWAGGFVAEMVPDARAGCLARGFGFAETPEAAVAIDGTACACVLACMSGEAAWPGAGL